MADLTDAELLAELGVEAEKPKERKYTPREERVIAGFEDITRFVDEHGHAPRHGEDRNIFERLYAVRLDRLKSLPDYHNLLAEFDKHALLDGDTAQQSEQPEDIEDDALLNALGLDPVSDNDIRVLRHVQSAEERRAADDVASRDKCPDFEKFEPLFEQVQSELDAGKRETRPFELKAEIRPGAFFIVSGQIAYVAEMGDLYTTEHGRSDARLRVIFDNGTESNMLMRSLQRALNKDDAGRRITEPEAGPLFSGEAENGDHASGIIYVLRSKSDHPLVAEHRKMVHKIGVTNMEVEKRIAGAQLQTTFLMANVEVMAEYRLFNISRSKLENLIHRVFGKAQLDIEVADRFGRIVKPREWFLVPLTVIDEAIEHIKDGTITNYRFDREQLRLVRI